VDGVVSGLGFRSVLLNLVRPDGDIEGVAVSGSVAMRNALVGAVGKRAEYERYLAKSQSWGALRFTLIDPDDFDLPVFFRDTPRDPDLDRWGPRHDLVAPMYRPDGVLLGALAFDDPESGCVPDAAQCEVLEAYAVKAAVAIINAQARQESGSEPSNT
jgi:GAF domain-containing protein